MKKSTKSLIEKIYKARNDYYNGESKVSDIVYDFWIDELKAIDQNHPAVTGIGAPVVQSEWQKAQHQIPMGSLDKVNTPEEFTKWAKSLGTEFLICDKLDGLSIELIYDDGKLIQSITKGDGSVGEDITSNVIKMQGVKQSIKEFTGSLRGEIILFKANHKEHFSDKSNPRNAASGISKRLDSVGVEHLNIIFYQVLGNVEFATEVEQFEWLAKQEIAHPNYKFCKFVDEVNAYWRKYQDEDRPNLPYEIDGLVVRLNDLEKQQAFGETNLRPKAAIAMKFDNLAKETTIINVHWQTGNSGRVTPVVEVEPIELNGAVVKNASVYNVANIKALRLNIGCKVLITRANDVIPKILENLSDNKNIFPIPTNCQECMHLLEMQGENLTCTNIENCKSQLSGRIKNWISELNILEWGSTLTERLVEQKLVNDISDLYKLSVEELANLERMGEKSAKKCHELLWKNTEIPLDILIGGLSINMIGSSTIRLLISAGYDSLEKLRNLSLEQLVNVNGIGVGRAKCLIDGLRYNSNLIDNILNNGIKIKEKVIGKLTGCKIAITGSTITKRSILEKFIADNGGEYKSSVGKSCTHLVIADINSDSSKAVYARKLGIKLINEESLLELNF